MEKEKRRIKFIDIAKGIAIICVILGHLKINEINRFVFTFHVPIFFIITGYFINNRFSIKEFIKRKYKTLIIPYIITSIIIVTLTTIYALLTRELIWAPVTAAEWTYAALYGSGTSYSEPIYIRAIGAIWFLLATFWGSIFFRISLEFKPINRIISIIILFFIGIWSRELLWLPFSIQTGCCATLFMYVGYLFKQIEYKFKDLKSYPKILLTIVALIVWIQFIINFKTFWLVHCDIGRGIIDIIGSICGCYIIFIISFFIEKCFSQTSKILSFLGENSIYVLCIHAIELTLIEWHKIILPLSKYIPLTNLSYVLILIFLKFTFIFTITYICLKYNIIEKMKIKFKLEIQ